MQKIPLRPLRLTRLTHQLAGEHSDNNCHGGREQEGGERIYCSVTDTDDAAGTIGPMKKLTDQHHAEYSATLLHNTSDAKPSQEHDAAHQLLQRAPNSYLFNQIYGFWFFLSSFLLNVLITRAVNPDHYGLYTVIQTTLNTIVYLAALGIEDAAVVFIPRILAEQGQAGAAQLARYLFGLRFLLLLLSVSVLLFGLPLLATAIALFPFNGAREMAQGLRDPILAQYTLPIALYVFGTGLGNLLSTFCTAQMRMQIVLIVGSVTQGVLLLCGFLLLSAGWGITGILWLQASVALLNALAFAIWQAPFFFTRTAHYKLPLRTIFRLSFSAWLTNLASGALLKQLSIILLGFFLISRTNIGYFNLSFQLADAANLLLVAGFAGVGGSALSAAFAGNNSDRLGQTWQVLIKVETLLAAPGLVFCLFNAPTIAHVLYGSQFDPVGPLLAIFLFFNLLVRILGTTVHQASLYVLGKPGNVVLSQWFGILIVLGSGVIFVPLLGAAGALIADGLAKVSTGILLLLFVGPRIPRHHRRELLVFTGRLMLALALAALPCVLWHPNDRLLLGASGALFIVLCLGLLLWMKPLSPTDMEMLGRVNPRFSRYLGYFARRTPLEQTSKPAKKQE